MFLKKHGFSTSLTNCDGPIFADYRVWIDLLQSTITQYRHKDLFNVDELVMYSDFLPPTTLSSKSNRLSMLICCNFSGTEKPEPVVSGPYVMSKNLTTDCYYQYNEYSYIEDNVFGEWLLRLNEIMSKSERKILLLLSRHRIGALQRGRELTHVNLLFFPNDFPYNLCPLRGDVFHCIKMMYRSKYVVEHPPHEPAGQAWAPEQIIENVVDAWKRVPEELIVHSFQRTKFRIDESFLKIHCPIWDSFETGISFRKFVTFDDELSVHESLTSSDDNKHHRYNLRRNRCSTVSLDDIGNIEEESIRANNFDAKISNDKCHELQGPSGLIKRRKSYRHVRLIA